MKRVVFLIALFTLAIVGTAFADDDAEVTIDLSIDSVMELTLDGHDSQNIQFNGNSPGVTEYKINRHSVEASSNNPDGWRLKMSITDGSVPANAGLYCSMTGTASIPVTDNTWAVCQATQMQIDWGTNVGNDVCSKEVDWAYDYGWDVEPGTYSATVTFELLPY
jgi:hypothetical protein